MWNRVIPPNIHLIARILWKLKIGKKETDNNLVITSHKISNRNILLFNLLTDTKISGDNGVSDSANIAWWINS